MGKTHRTVYTYPKRTSERREALASQTLEDAYQEWADMSESIFTIVGEYRPNDSEYDLKEILGEYYLTHQEARDALLWMAANEYHVELDLGCNYFEVPTPEAGIEYQIYYIEELIRG